MAVRIRMTRMGRRHRPFFRINAVDGRTPRDGTILEKLGHYDPLEKNSEKQLVLDLDRVKHWLDQGATVSDTIGQILLKQGIEAKNYMEKVARRAKAREIAKKKGQIFIKADRIKAAKDREAAKEAEAAAAAAAAEEAKKQAEAAAKEAEGEGGGE